MTEPTWKKYLTDYNEGLGLVYERFVLNDFLLDLKGRYGFANVIEAPLYGMAGVSGINSVALARSRRPSPCSTITLSGSRASGGSGASWACPPDLASLTTGRKLPFPDNTFEFAWNWAAIWHLNNPAALLSELVRVSNKLVFVAMPNPVQVGYQVRKHIVEPEFVNEIDERWTSISLIRATLERPGRHDPRAGRPRHPAVARHGHARQPAPAKLGIRSKKLDSKFTGEGWQWSTMDYYLGNDYSLYPRVMKYARLERWRLPWKIKQVWSHHRWVLGKKTAPAA